MTSPNYGDQQNKSEQAPEREFEKEALPAVVREFDLRSFRFQNWIQRSRDSKSRERRAYGFKQLLFLRYYQTRPNQKINQTVDGWSISVPRN